MTARIEAAPPLTRRRPEGMIGAGSAANGGARVRVVSLVPSLTEAVALTVPGALVGATDWCSHPAGLDVARVGGSKYPDLDRVRALRPDLVLLNVEENRRADAEALRAAGVPVRVTYPRTVRRRVDRAGRPARRAGCADRAGLAARRPAGVGRRRPGWRRPAARWCRSGVGRGWCSAATRSPATCCAASACVNAYDEHPERYPRPTLAELREREPDLVVLPDEPYRFTADDGPEAFPGVPCALLSGRHLTWYGPSLAEAPALLADQLSRPVLVG